MDQELKRGLKEAATAVCALILIGIVLAALFFVSGCTYWREHPTEMRAWASVDVARQPPFGKEPTGNILISQPLPAFMEAHFLHQSSIPSYYDKAEVNSVGLGFCVKVPLRRCDQ